MQRFSFAVSMNYEKSVFCLPIIGISAPVLTSDS